MSVEVGFWIPIVSGIPDSLSCSVRIPKPRIPDSLSCIPDSKTPDAGFHISQAKISWIANPDSLTRGRLYDFLSFISLNPAIKLLTFDERF